MANPKTVTVTRKVQVVINSDDKAYVKETYEKLYKWQYMCFRSANYIVTHLFVQEKISEFFYMEEEARNKLVDVKKDADGILNTSRANTIYQVLSKKFKGEMPMSIAANLANNLYGTFRKERSDYFKGTKSIRNYKKGIPMPFAGSDILHLADDGSGRIFSFVLFGIPFKTYFGKDFSDKPVLFHRILTGEIQLKGSSIQLKDNKIFWLATMQIPVLSGALDENVMAEASLSMEYPIIVSIGKYKYQIGNKEEFLHRRLAIQAACQRAQKAAAGNRPGHGRKRKLKNVDHFREMERHYVDHKLHVYSRRLIDLCLKHKAASLILVDQKEKEAIAKEQSNAEPAEPFLLRNWSYFSLKTKIAYKADMAGIPLIEE